MLGSSRVHPSRVFIPPVRLPVMLFQDLGSKLGKFTLPIQRIFQYSQQLDSRNAAVYFSSPMDLRFDFRRQC
jgi:hypothetical protein